MAAIRKRHNKVQRQKYALIDDSSFRIIRWQVPLGTQAGPLDPEDLGMLDEENLAIHVRACGSPQDEKRTIIHELLHRAFGTDYTRVSEAKLKQADGRLVADLEALGVDLSPLTEGYDD